MRRTFQFSRFRWLAAAGLWSALLFSSPNTGNAEPSETLIAGGTGSGLEIIRLLAEAYSQQAPSEKIKVVPSLGSGGGIKAVLKGKLSFSVSARALKDKEIAAGAISYEIAKTPMVFLTQAENPVDAVNLELLTKVYSGQSATWPDGMPVRVVMRPLKESDTKFLRGLSAEIDQGIVDMVSQDKAFVATNDQQNAEALENVSGSLGFASYGQILSEKRKLKHLTFQGRNDVLADLKAGDYPYVKTLRLVLMGQADPAVTAFCDFVRSAKGAEVLEKNGFLAVLSEANQ
ncbi:PstS family phosphate ABC transporter substrate-binding protein [Labrenzia sp. PHM005]|uniref:PstS family phosphate ABC transporter substrate-binding protein n=1 Tax=Labrenzia sp. PHM005 TaxID=2590016 RepID=UPI00113FD69F|nr:substrate-binding domain-containing protein [Labrenzia sp. PHM005]QDG79051.1 hypothetical protein FJ695_26035 [Labrenzia sp. PHM005]